MSVPTAKQATKLRVLAGGYAVLAPRRGEWVGLLRRGWVERIDQTTPRGGLLPPLRITPDGERALALVPEEDTCNATTSAPSSLSPVGSGRPLPSLPSLGWASPLPRRAWTRPNCSSGSAAARLRPTRRPLWPLPSADDVADELMDEWGALDSRTSGRGRGGYAGGWRCWSCRKFVSGPQATCGRCGQRHGGVNHEAYAGR